jgi:hypothetical protein
MLMILFQCRLELGHRLLILADQIPLQAAHVILISG